MKKCYKTLEYDNLTGIVHNGFAYAFNYDAFGNVSVVPVGVSIQTWINAGSGSIWTQAVKSVVVKWEETKWEQILILFLKC